MQKHSSPVLFKSLLLLPILIAACAHSVTVTRAVDGDTLALSNGKKIRLIGVDTPESFDNAKLARDSKATGQPSSEMQRLGKQSTEYTQSLVAGKRVRLEYGRERKDKYGRTLAYVFLTDGKMLNREIIRQGFGCFYGRFPFSYKQDFKAVQNEAKANKRGLWPQLQCQ